MSYIDVVTDLSVSKELASAQSPKEIVQKLLRVLGEGFYPHSLFAQTESLLWSGTLVWTRSEEGGWPDAEITSILRTLQKESSEVKPTFIFDRNNDAPSCTEALSDTSYAWMSFYQGGKRNLSFVLIDDRRRVWTQKEIEQIKQVGELASFYINLQDSKESVKHVEKETKKIQALYAVSSAVKGFVDPANVAYRGVQVLSDALGADGGLCYLFSADDRHELELKAHHGFSSHFSSVIDSVAPQPSMLRAVAQSGEPRVINNLLAEPRASLMINAEGMKSAIIAPIEADGEIVGVVGFYSKNFSKFKEDDLLLVLAATNQIGLTARQANLLKAYKEQTKNLAILYRISHELSKAVTLEEVFYKSFTVIKDELYIKRLWLGLLNETGTRIIGQAALGPGFKKKLVEMNVEISDSHHPIAQVVRSREPLILTKSEGLLKEFGFRKIFSRLEINAVILVPLISAGQVFGVLAVQPTGEDRRMFADKIGLLSSIANEIGSAVLGRKLDERTSEQERMRAASFLAAGIAHNFNNLLQAIMGQASMIELQKNEPATISRSSEIIMKAAERGASLVRQLMRVANLEDPRREVVDINLFLQSNMPVFEKVLAEEQHIEVMYDTDIPKAFIDPEQLRRILYGLLNNAREAMGKTGTVQVFTNDIVVNEKQPHYEVPNGWYVRIGIRDDGRGMDAETKRRCFEPFFTTKNVDPGSGLSLTGSGLGLAASYALAKRNGGRLVVESRPGHGALFTIFIPVAEEGLTSRALPTHIQYSKESSVEHAFLESPQKGFVRNLSERRGRDEEKK